MALKPETMGATAALDLVIRDLESEELVARRRFDTATVAFELAKRGEPGSAPIDLAERSYGHWRTRWELVSSALKVARRKQERLLELAGEEA